MTGDTAGSGSGTATAQRGITQRNLENWFTYHPPRPDQQKRYEAIRGAAQELATVIINNTPPGNDQFQAIQQLRQLVMTANQCIACEGG